MSALRPKIRVLHVITRLVPGGADENTLATVEGLDKSIYSVDLLIGGQSDFAFAAQTHGTRLIILHELVREPKWSSDIRALFKLVRIIRRNRYHIVHTHTAKAGMLGRLAGFIVKAPLVIHTLHGSTFHESLSPWRRRWYRFLERMAAAATTQFVTVGEDLRSIYLDARVGQADRYITIRSGFQLQRFQLSEQEVKQRSRRMRGSLDISDQEAVVGTAGRLEARKGHSYFLQTAQQVLQHHPQVTFLLAGEGPANRDLIELARRLGIEQRVRFLGYRYDIEDVMAAMDVFVLTSLWEGLPRVLVQAAALGKPIVTFEIEGVREVVVDGDNGYVVPLRDVTGLADRVAWLVKDRTTARQMGERGRQRVTAEWDVQTMVHRISELYRHLLLRKGIDMESIANNKWNRL
jgi:glycosyltransferase involved in cell wall biosynthesis